MSGGTGRAAGPDEEGGGTRDDRGSGTVLVAVWMAALVVLAGAALVLASVVHARVRLAAAVDLAALAGASAVVSAPGQECARAAAVARANGAALESCTVTGSEVRVEASSAVPPAASRVAQGRAGRLRARAHAELVPGSP